MNRLYFSKLAVLVTILLGCASGVFAQPITTFSVNNASGNSGNPYTYTVPAGCTLVAIDAAGATGGAETYENSGYGGLGGRVQCQMAVTGGQVLYCYVGGMGTSIGCCSSGFVAGGYNGGGATQFYICGTGGGGTDISSNAGTLTSRNRLVVAGGGAGGGYGYCGCGTPSTNPGGAGGGLTGGNGYYGGSTSYSGTCYGGQPGNQTAGGPLGTCTSGQTAGSLAQGGSGASGYYGGGGGGGYYGGAGAYAGGGGGGSSYTNATYCSAVTHTQGFWNSGDGYIKIQPLVPTLTLAPTSLSFGAVTVGTNSVPQAFTMSAVRLTPATGNDTIWAPAAGYQIATDLNPTWTSTYIVVPYSGGTINTMNVYVMFSPTLPISYCGFPVVITGGGATGSVNVCGIGANACSGTPTTGTASITPTTGGGGTPFSLNLTGGTVAGGLVYDWQSSPSLGGPYTDIPGGVSQTFNFTGITATTRYKAIVTCPGFPSATSNTVTATYAGVATAGCSVSTITTCTGCGFYVGNGTANPFVVNGEAGTKINDASVASPPYIDLTSSQSVSLGSPGTYSGTDKATASNAMAMQIWIDFNNDGTFQTSESVGGANWTAGTVMPNVPIVVPAGIPQGSYRMRVMIDYNCCGGTYYPSYPSLNPCGGMEYTDARDYTVNIVLPGCSGTPLSGITYPAVSTGCSPYTANVYNVGPTSASGITYSWQSSPDGLSWTTIPGATNAVYTQSVTSTVYLRDVVTCVPSATSVMSPAMALTLNPTPAALTGITNICTALPQTLASTTMGGAWSSSNLAIANVGSTGVVTGTGAGTSTISYTMPTGCAATATVTVNLSPGAITGTASVCTGLTTTLTDGPGGGAWSSSDITLATVSGGVVTGVASTGVNPIISYTLPSGCSSVRSVTVNQSPATITGSSSVCVGSTTALGNAKAGGTWTSSNSFKASVDPITGLVTGIVASAQTISYTLPGGCVATLPITVNAVPGTIGGASSVCVGTTATLTDGGTGTWSSSNPSVATIVAGTGAVTGVASGSSTITYKVTATGCTATLPLPVISEPTQYAVTGGGGYCSGSLTGAHIGLSGSDVGINYSLYNSLIGLESTVSGSHSGLDFGAYTDTGRYIVVATDATYGCTDTMLFSKSIHVDPLPVLETVGGGGPYCAGGTGVQITVTPSELGVNYQVYKGIIPMGPSVPGTGGSGTLNLGLQTVSTTYNVIATNATTLCSSNMTGVAFVSINNLPIAYTVMTPGSSSYCAGTGGVEVRLSGSDIGINYSLYMGPTFIKMVSGTGSGISFGFYTTAGCYTVVAADASSGCTANMTGSVCITVNPVPIPQIMTGGGGFCSGGIGRHVGLNFSVSGTRYALLYAGGPTGDTVSGSNSGLDFGLQTTAGNYTSVAINSFGCTTNMIGMETVSVQPLPNPYSVSTGGGYCAGATGFDVQVTGSDLGVNYSLYKNGTTLVASKPGTTSAVDFGNQPAGTYTVVGVNGTTGCAAQMPGSSTVVMNALPIIYKVMGGGHFCTGGSGADVWLQNSEVGVSYDLYLGPTYITTMTGIGGKLDFGNQPLGGCYSIYATNGSSCKSTMSGTACVTVDPLPAVYPMTVTNGGNYCAGASGQEIDLGVSNVGVTYQLTNPGNVGMAIGGTGGKLSFGVHTAGTYNITATTTANGCQNTMGGPVTITQIALPVVYTITDSGNYCAGSLTGSDVYLSGSDVADVYKLYSGTTYLGSTSGTGLALDLGHHLAGTYTAVAVDPVYGCVSNMSSSAKVGINPLPAVQTVTGGGHYCAGGSGVPVGLKKSAVGINYQLYNTAGMIVGADSAGTGGAITYGNETSADMYTVVATDAVTGCSNNMTGSATVVIDTLVTPSVSIATAADTVCIGSKATFTATPVNGGTSPMYQWMVNGVNMTSTGSKFTYTPTDTDMVTVQLVSNAVCTTPSDTTVSSAIEMHVNPGVTPSVAISANPGATVCSGTSVTYTAAPTLGGTTPIYQWKLNGMPVGTNSTTYSTTPNDSDVVFVIMQSNVACNLVPFVLSTPITMLVNSAQSPDFTITASPSLTIAHGTPVTFTAWVTNPTGTFSYQWLVNGNAVTGATSGVFVSSTLNDNDNVTCTVSDKNSCGTLSASHDLFMSVSTLGVASINSNSDVRVIPNPNKGTFNVKGSLGTAADEEVTMEITNMLGQVVYTSKVMVHNGNINEQVQLSNTLANGMYLLNLRSAAETKVFHFVIEQ